MSAIAIYLKSCRELARFCSQNGWIDNHSLRYTIMLETDKEVFVEVAFDELLMDGFGQIGGRVSCCGQLHLYLDDFGHVIRADIL
jgi:hypothetical protein